MRHNNTHSRKCEGLSYLQISARALATGVPAHLAKRFARTVFRWIEQSGVGWTVDRLKVATVQLAKVAADPSGEIVLPEDLWLGKKSKRRFSGVLGQLQRYAERSPRCLERVVKLLTLYTSFISRDLPQEDRAKFLKGLLEKGSPVNPSTLRYLFRGDAVSSFYRYFRRPRLGTIRPYELSTWPDNQKGRFSDGIMEFFHYGSLSQDFALMFKDLLHDLGPLFDFGQEETAKYVDMEKVRQRVLRSLRDVAVSQDEMGHGRRPIDHFPSLGEIHVHLQEGLKSRFYLAPSLWVQALVEPLKKYFLEICRQLPWDCTHDHCKADEHVHAALRSGKTVYCFDLSSATDRFPLELQLELAKHLGLPKVWQDLIEVVARWPVTFQGQKVAWRRGQGLGLGFSFPLFAMTHGFCLFSLLGPNPRYRHQFFVLGDDVLITDPDLALRYKSFLREIEVKCSPHKSLISAKIAEFAGHLYHAGKKFRKIKWKHANDDNVLDLVKDWGPQLVDLLPSGMAQAVKTVAALPEPLGLGWNPEGKSLEERMDAVLDLYIEEREQVIPYMTSSREFARRLRDPKLRRLRFHQMAIYHYDGTDSTEDRVTTGLQTSLRNFDQKILREASKVIPIGDTQLASSLSRTLAEVSDDLDLPRTSKRKFRHRKTQGRLSSLIKKIKDAIGP